MVQWLCKGIKYFIPKGSHVDIILDNCTDKSKYWLENLGPYSLENYVFNFYESTISYRWQNTNEAIKRFLKTDCDIFLSPQDDQKIQDAFLIQNLKDLYDQNKNVGIIGMRDGIINGRFWSAHHSLITDNTTWLAAGDYLPVDEINDGPICLSRETIEKIGLFDTENFISFYTDTDYSRRCTKAGLQNYVMGAEIVHEKWGNVQASTIYTQEIASHDWDNFKKKYIVGHF